MIYTKNNRYELHLGKMQDVLATFQSESVDAVVTDPSYELNFMSKGWDNSGVAFQKETWQHCYRVLKPGGYLLAFGGTRTFHRIACAIEDAGFEIRDTIMWLYGSGFPKSLNIGLAIDKKNGVDSPVVAQNQDILKKQAKNIREGHRKIVDSFDAGADGRNNGFKTVSADIRQAQNKWAGWGTCLKPAYEPIIVARKPFKGSLVDNVFENGVGGLNIDECRVGDEKIKTQAKKEAKDSFMHTSGYLGCEESWHNGRFPANVILTYDETDKNEVCGGMPNTGYDDEGSAARYFYCAKASKRDRDEGLDAFESTIVCDRNENCYSANTAFNRSANPKRNIHPTVKPVDLMQYLIRLVCPKGSVILDPFNGSGSTGKAVMYENNDRNANYYYIGIEMTEEYLPISKARIDYAIKDKEKVEFNSEPVEKDSDNSDKSKQHKIDLW